MAEIGFEALAWKMFEENKSLAMATSVLMYVVLHLAGASIVPVFILEAMKYLHGHVVSLDECIFGVG